MKHIIERESLINKRFDKFSQMCFEVFLAI